MNWLEVSLKVNGELAEAVADVFARFAPGGVATEQGIAFLSDEDAGTASGPITVRAYLPVDGQLEATRHKLEAALYYLGTIQPLPEATFRSIADQNWMEAWKQHYHPIQIGKRLMIIPAWIEPSDPARIPIRIDPGMAFGTGTHPTTQLCLELMEGCFGAGLSAPGRMIDVGCGSGILGIAALKLGCRLALGVDIDAESLTNARENAALNSTGSELDLALGSVPEILSGRFAFKSAPLVVANILAPVIIRLFDAGLARLLEPAGTLILSGILEHQAGDVLAAGQAQGLSLAARAQRADWVALRLAAPRS
jgi:ribosomal protein L11 methyltransferase